jgi:glycosyltransferase involved in cell wall biosynthesis
MVKMKKVLIICYYWPPAGGSGVQRPLKFAKYLRDFGWEPIIYTAKNGEYPEMDETLLSEVPTGLEVIHRPIWEPYTFYKFFSGKKKKERITPNFFSQKKVGFVQQLAIFIRSNFFIPDARMWWIKPSVQYLTEYLKTNPVDAIISTGPPHSLHLIGKGLKENTGIPWLADFRDPWTNIDYFKDLTLLPFAKEKHQRLEKEVLEKADKVLAVSPTWGKELGELGSRKVEVITNGFDETDFVHHAGSLDDKFTIVHPGMFSKARNHEIFWQALAELVQENPYFARDLSILFYGITDASVVEKANKYGLEKYVEVGKYVPHHEIVKIMASAWVLLLSVHDSSNLQGFVPGKLFEYLASKRPILCIGPTNGDSAHIIKSTQAGTVVDFHDKHKLKITLMAYYGSFINKFTNIETQGIEKYSRRSLTGELATLLDEMVVNTNIKKD